MIKKNLLKKLKLSFTNSGLNQSMKSIKENLHALQKLNKIVEFEPNLSAEEKAKRK